MTFAVIDAALELLRCPVCGDRLHRVERVLRCPARHSFDIARQGHVNLLGHTAPANADTAAMVAARDRFLSAGHYAPIRDVVVRAAAGSGAVVEVGAGTGYYLAGAIAADPARPHLALDVAVAASRISARAGLASVVADTWGTLPVAAGSVERLLCVFAPRNPVEFAKVLAPDGQLVVVTPRSEHLAGLRVQYRLLAVPPGKTDRLDADLAAVGLRLAGREQVEFELALDARQVADLISMGPNAFHLDGPMTTQATHTVACVVVSRYQPQLN